jgi:hypothetical protein
MLSWGPAPGALHREGRCQAEFGCQPRRVVAVLSTNFYLEGCMIYDHIKLRRIFEKTDGRCHLSGRKLRFKDYGDADASGGWEVDHSVPRACGGTDHGNNLFPAAISANRAKQDRSTRSIRNAHGLTRAPPSREEKLRLQEETQAEAALAGLGGGAAAGAGLGVLWAAASDSKEYAAAKVVVGTILGAFIGALLSS